MRVQEHCTRPAITVEADATARRAAELMYEHAVGSLVVVDGEGQVVGIVTDRDLCLRGVAPAGSRGHAADVGSLMSAPVESLAPDDSVDEASRRMRTLGIRRMPVCRDGKPVGLLALDDLLEVLSGALHDLAVETRKRQRRSSREARQNALAEEVETLYHELRDRMRSAKWQAQETFLHDIDVLKESIARILGRTDT